MRKERMTAFVAQDCDAPVEVGVERVAAGAGQVKCFACGGTGLSPSPQNSIRPGPAATARQGFRLRVGEF